LKELLVETSFREALFAGFVQLFVLAIAAILGNVIYRRIRDRSQARVDLMRDIYSFTVQLYKPRKLYQLCIAARDAGLPGTYTLSNEVQRVQIQARAMEELVAVIGQFR